MWENMIAVISENERVVVGADMNGHVGKRLGNMNKCTEDGGLDKEMKKVKDS